LEFRSLIRSLTGVAVILSTHLVEDVAAVCDDVVVLNGGRVVFHGSPEQLRNRQQSCAEGDSDLERGYMTVLAG
jgi:ABC-2 type transport system ATP-binding protein